MSEGGFTRALMAPELPVPEGLVAPGGRPAGARFDVYRNNVIVSLTDALGVAFPAVRRLVGPVFFAAMAREFLRAHPPRSPRLALWGAALPGWLEDFPPVAKLGYLPDVARLEQALREAYHAADASPIAPERLGALPPERLMRTRLHLAPAARALASAWPALSIWRGETPAMRAEEMLVARPGFDPVALSLPEGGAAFVDRLSEGLPLGRALAPVPRGFDLAAVLGALISGQAITDLTEAT
ncbi:DNA-binding domain-containing protein [Limimaricola pyoseonensis]|uniref:Putative DNA-binding domain-containing protein n=1 Tax=Limimaricola pyoseonensis TaxID=521013 RepID=A0A1G7FYN4_9RHOB|nr:DNA-binding domain-containing protein [Limimaricola pyoseonensis]SDE80959.1 Putative DNA-binding domain-containing protein [Limimaricola pyoseonensis]